MTDLNVTEGEWFADDINAAVEADGVVIADCDVFELPVEEVDANTYLIAQAKNMYEMLSELLKNDECDVFEMSSEIQELLNACKPSEE